MQNAFYSLHGGLLRPLKAQQVNSTQTSKFECSDGAKAQEITKDKELGGINESIDVDMAYIKDFKGRVKEDAEAIKELSKNTRTIVGQPHYYRNQFNDPKKANPKNGGIVMSDKESALHGEGNIKSISPNGGNHERVVSGKTNQVLDEDNNPEFMGSYNVFNPRGSAFERAGHAIVDVVPYVLFGNSENDPSNIFERTKNTSKAAVNYAK